jgi:hypothetical protein
MFFIIPLYRKTDILQEKREKKKTKRGKYFAERLLA